MYWFYNYMFFFFDIIFECSAMFRFLTRVVSGSKLELFYKLLGKLKTKYGKKEFLCKISFRPN